MSGLIESRQDDGQLFAGRNVSIQSILFTHLLPLATHSVQGHDGVDASAPTIFLMRMTTKSRDFVVTIPKGLRLKNGLYLDFSANDKVRVAAVLGGRGGGYIYSSSSAQMFTGRGSVQSFMYYASSAGDATIGIHDEVGANKLLYNLGVAKNTTHSQYFPDPLEFHKGLYADISGTSSITAFLA